MFSNKNRYLRLLPILALTLFMTMGCDKDNPVEPDDHDEEHAEAEGLIIKNSGAEIVRYEKGNVTGEIEVDEGEMTALLLVKFINLEGALFVPEGDEYSMQYEIADTSIAGVVQHAGEDWEFHIKGKEHGETTIVLKIFHGDHADFISKPIPIHVHEHEGEHAEAEGLVLIMESSGDTLVTVAEGKATGKVSVKAGEESGHVAVKFFDDHMHYFTPDAEHHSLAFTVADTNIAVIEQHDGEPWSLEVVGKKAGITTFMMQLMHEGHPDFNTPDITIEVTN